MSEKDKFEVDRSGDPMSYSSGVPPDWRFGSGNLVNSSVGLVAMGSSSCSASMVDSFGPNFWDHNHNSNSQNMGFSDINNGSSSNTTAMGFLPNGQGVFPQSLSQFPTDSGFIERAARFSCFSGGSFGDVVHSYGVPQSMSLYGGTSGTIHGTRDSLAGHGLKSVTGGQSQESDLNVVEASKALSPSIEHLATKGSDSRVVSQDEGKSALVRPVNDSERPESSDGGHGQDGSPMLDGTSGEPSNKGLNSKKRKKSGPDSDNGEANGTPEARSEDAKENSESQQKGDQQLTSANKASGKNAKQGSPASDPPKEEYIHVRARRGQATNSHSLAERVRREKISERMKFLQELVPGCSKVTGKAVMLDEIINYVQSLQRQVEFLSMKLATVNPRLDFNIEGLLAKDILHQRPGPSSGLGFPLEMSMNFPPLHPSQQPGLIQSVIPNMPNSSDILRRAIHPQLVHLSAGFKEPNQMPDVWEDELHNVVQMSFATTAPTSSQDVDGSATASQMKVEL